MHIVTRVNFQRNNPLTLVGHIGSRIDASIVGGLHSIQQRELGVDAPHSGTEMSGFSRSAILSLLRRVGFLQSQYLAYFGQVRSTGTA
ncbi:hypothetical protein DPMN_075299 [Dreissena polymorpha]|uniref:Uncharacterized protein n=1 Tax=Dreissena polymorpha TaxID=45954 RepID=A0A9D4BMD6_DREPO|nr:hypothetical protein DPMN_075299 [Dreissena polymorpha]